MGNSPSKREKSSGGSGSKAHRTLGDLQAQVQSGISRLEEQNHPAAQILDSMCGPYLDEEDLEEDDEEEDDLDDLDDEDSRRRRRRRRGNAGPTRDPSFYSDEDDLYSEESSRRRRRGRKGAASATAKQRKDEPSVGTDSYVSDELYEDTTLTGGSDGGDDSRKRHDETTDDDTATYDAPPVSAHHHYNPHTNQALKTPLASAFAKRCYFTKSGIGMNSQHYEGLTLTGNVVLMLATAMKLKGCPTICDEDLRRVEQTYPNQFSRLPDELLLSSGWRRISKHCHFSHKPIPDGVPFFHSKQRLHDKGGYYFLLASAVGMVNPAEVEPLSRDTLVLLETDFPDSCDNAPQQLINDPSEWTLVDRFCFFSGGPINTDEDVYYQASLEGQVIFMLAFLSPSLTPAELYKLEENPNASNAGDDDGAYAMSVAAVHEVETVYDLTHRDFDDLKLYHLGPCRALPDYILQPEAWTKVLPPNFLEARDEALRRAMANSPGAEEEEYYHSSGAMEQQQQQAPQFTVGSSAHSRHVAQPPPASEAMYSEYDELGGAGRRSFDSFQEEEGAFVSQAVNVARDQHLAQMSPAPLDESDQPPSLSKNHEYHYHHSGGGNSSVNSSYYESSELRPEDEDNADDDEVMGSTHLRHGNRPVSATSGSSNHQGSRPVSASSGNRPSSQQQHLDEDQFDFHEEQQSEFGNSGFHSTAGDAHISNGLEMENNNDDEYYDDPVAQQDQPPNGTLTAENLNYDFDDTDPYRTSPSQESRPPRSPNSQTGTEFSQSSAMKGAQALLRRNRQRRLEKQQEMQRQQSQQQQPLDNYSWDAPRSEVSAGTWGSEVSSGFSGASSSWTDGSEPEDRSSRRALILQMAKTRMKGHQTKLPREDTSATEDTTYDEEKKEAHSPENIDLTADLD